MELSDRIIGFIGAGNMANALLKGLINSGLYTAEQLAASDSDEEKLRGVFDSLGVKAFSSNIDLARESNIIIFSVKPQVIRDVLEEIKDDIKGDDLVISIAAGIPIKMIQSIIGHEIPIIRVMPNTPALIQRGVSALAPGKRATSDHMDMAKVIFDAVGKSVVVDEAMMDAVTALSGSGPGFVFKIMECFVQAGVEQGFDEQTALQLVIQTFLGAAHLAEESDLSLSRLREMVTSPGGTTAAGLASFEEKGLADTIKGAVDAACRRSVELGSV